jgi:hypothetical protein
LPVKIDIEIDIGNDLTQKEQTILFHSARNYEVSKILGGIINFEYALK